MRARTKFMATVAAMLVTVSCGGSSSSPTAPSSPLPTGSGSAVIGGTIRVSSGAGSSLWASAGLPGAAAVPAGTSIEVVGTGISAPVDANGAFTLQGVPSGDARLRVRGQQMDASFGLSQVQAGQRITVVVAVSGSTAVVESESRSSSGLQELEGRIESLAPTPPPGELVVAGRSVRVTETTVIRRGNATLQFGDLQIGQRVHVRGTPDGMVLVAESITLQNENTDIQIPVNGLVEGLTGAADDFRFFVNGREIRGDADTRFFGEGNTPLGFDRMRDGVRAEVKALQRDGYLYAVRIHVNEEEEEEDAEDPQQESASIEGPLTQMVGTPPDLELTVGGTLVRTNASTRVDRRGDRQTLDDLAPGQTLHVVGDRQPDGSLDARKIQIKGDEPGAPVRIAGSMGGLKGTCPTVQFGVNGFKIVTDAATVYTGTTCEQLKNGTKVDVLGTQQADGTFLANDVKR